MPFPYKYRLLGTDEIRLLRLTGGRPDSELHGSLEIHKFPQDAQKDERSQASRPNYEALSYYWGLKADNPEQYTIKIMEGSRSYEIQIRPNLDDALRRLRHESEDRYLWVDALCINQEKHDRDAIFEKNSQIPRMHQVYNRAECVDIWLGVEAEESANAMAFVSKMLDLEAFHKSMQDEAQEAAELANFAKLLRRPWFSRRWIVQELAVARKAIIYCGGAELPWKDFAWAISLFSSKHVDLRKKFRSSAEHGHRPDFLGDVREYSAFQLVHADTHFLRKSKDGDIIDYLLSLEDVVSMLSDFNGYDPRDVVYAVIALSSDARAGVKSKADFAKSRVKDMKTDLFLQDRFQEMRDTSPVSGDEADGDTSRLGPKLTKQTSHEGAPLDSSVHSTSNLQSSSLLHPTDPFTRRVRQILEEAISSFKKPFLSMLQIRTDAPVFEVYKDFLEHVITKSQSLDILSRPWAADVPDLPSWIQGKRNSTHSLRNEQAFTRVRGELFVGTPRTGGKIYNATRNTKVEKFDFRNPPEVPKSLVVKGFVFDAIESKLLPADRSNIPSDWFDKWTELHENDTEGAFPVDAFWRTLVADRGLEGQKPPPPYYELAFEHICKRLIPRAGLDVRDLMDGECTPIETEFLERLRAVVCARRFVVSKLRRCIGLAPRETRKRDLICFLDGCSTPVILRKIPVTANTSQSHSPSHSKKPSTAQAPLINQSSDKGRTVMMHGIPYQDLLDLDKVKPAKPTHGETVSHLGIQPPSRNRRPSITLQLETGSSDGTGIRELLPTAPTDSANSDKQVQESLHEALSNPIDDSSRSVSPPADQGSINPSAQLPNGGKVLTVGGIASAQARTPSRPASPQRQRASSEVNGSIKDPSQLSAAISQPKPMGSSSSRVPSWKLPQYYYQFIGECYIHGVMEGEATKYFKYKKEEFWLR